MTIRDVAPNETPGYVFRHSVLSVPFNTQAIFEDAGHYPGSFMGSDGIVITVQPLQHIDRTPPVIVGTVPPKPIACPAG